ncbi:hypothetical protein BC628DRAFT_726020 [Trametes gibbosa]|nr:hypothetical protein BC628DRAFT_726020 [Trametes gibbosa]
MSACARRRSGGTRASRRALRLLGIRGALGAKGYVLWRVGGCNMSGGRQRRPGQRAQLNEGQRDHVRGASAASSVLPSTSARGVFDGFVQAQHDVARCVNINKPVVFAFAFANQRTHSHGGASHAFGSRTEGGEGFGSLARRVSPVPRDSRERHKRGHRRPGLRQGLRWALEDRRRRVRKRSQLPQCWHRWQPTSSMPSHCSPEATWGLSHMRPGAPPRGDHYRQGPTRPGTIIVFDGER